MSEIFSGVEEMAGKVKDYIHVVIDRVNLKTAEKTSMVMANIIAIAIVSVVFLLFLVFVSIAGAYALSGWIGRPWAGFLVVGIIYLIIGIAVWKGREQMIRIPVMNNILAQLFKNKDEEEKNQ